MKFEVTVSGSFTTEILVEANSAEEASKAADDIFDLQCGLSTEDFVIDGHCVEEVR